MDFSDALRHVKAGRKVRRPMWAELDGKIGAWLELADASGIINVDGGTRVLVCPHGDGSVGLFAGAHRDILAEDWELA